MRTSTLIRRGCLAAWLVSLAVASGCSSDPTTFDRAVTACETWQREDVCGDVCADPTAGVDCPTPAPSSPGSEDLRECLRACTTSRTAIDCGAATLVGCSCAAPCLEHTTPELQAAYAAAFECYAARRSAACGR